MFDPNIQAKLVFDGGDVTVPQDLMPRKLTPEQGWEKIRKAEQLQGSPKEQVCELAGRACYDSLGQGRNSKQYWEHIREVGHFSVIEHAYYTVRVYNWSDLADLLLSLLNRRGVWVSADNDLRITFNIRALMDWDKWTKKSSQSISEYATIFGNSLYQLIQPQASLILPERNIAGDIKISEIMELVEPVYPNETTVSMFLSGSRGWSHEQVRHRENISQRSTRYVDENESPWVRHPLIEAYLTEKEKEGYENDALLGHYVDGKMQMPWAGTAIEQCRRTYSETVDRLQQWLLSKGVDKLTARKQARGAARGYLGNALRTEMIFTTSVDGWKEIIRQRLNAAADAEIRCLYGMVLDELKKSRYASEFDKFMTVPASDGLGVVLKEIS